MEIIGSHPGEFAALLTAIFWTVSALAFEKATVRFGSIAVNFLKLAAGFIFLTILIYIRQRPILPTDAGFDNWFWLILSGFAGFVFGDLFLFKSYALIGSRFSMLVMTLVPPLTALFGWIIMGEHLTALNFLGMTLTFTGIAMAILTRGDNNNGKLVMKLAPVGLLYATGGAVGQAMGLVLSRYGLKDYDPFSATQIRIIAGMAGFGIIATIMKRWGRIRGAFHDGPGFKSLTVGSFFGPFLGVLFSLISVKFTKAGIASTIMALTPVFILIPAILFYKQKVTFPEIAGAVLSVCGVALFFI